MFFIKPLFTVCYMNIAVDIMGGDFSPAEQVRGAVRAVREKGVAITLIGDENAARKELDALGYSENNIKIVAADEVISNDEEPAVAVRKKKNSSVVLAAKEVSEGRADALVSCGNTGAVLASGILVIGRMKGILRPALAPVIPTLQEPTLLLDCGANADCKSANLAQFAMMGSIYMSEVLDRKNPKVALANIGSEPHKGNELTKASYELISGMNLNFAGNIEGREMLDGDVDVIVADGFTGNMILKLTEGVSAQMLHMIKDMMLSNAKTKFAALMLKDEFKNLKKRMDYEEYGGALLLGCKAPVIKCHGASKEKAVYYGIMQAKKCIESGMLGKIENAILQM